MANEFNPEKMMAAARQEQEDRKTAVERITKYILEKFPIAESGESSIFERLRGIDRQEFLSLPQEINATVRGLEAKDVELFPPNIKVKTPDMSIIQKTEFHFPKAEQRRQLMDEVAEKIKQLAVRDNEQARQAIAQILYNATTYLHPFTDGNGRTARLLYFLSSPHIKRSPEKIKEIVQHLVEARDKKINEYHDRFDLSIYQGMLKDRRLSTDPAADGGYACRMEDTEILGFDGQYLQVLAAADVLTDEEKQQYNVSQHPGALAFDGYKLPDEIKARIKTKMNDIRTEFVRHIIEVSTDEETPGWLVEPLDKAFSIEEKEGL